MRCRGNRQKRPNRAADPSGPQPGTPFGQLFGTRSGDKGPNANLGVFARNAVNFQWLSGYLTTQKLKQLLPDLSHLPITRHDFPNLLSLNFVIEQILEEGVAASTRFDPQAKGLGEYLRSTHIR